jgi:hypothetical protein
MYGSYSELLVLQINRGCRYLVLVISFTKYCNFFHVLLFATANLIEPVITGSENLIGIVLCPYQVLIDRESSVAEITQQ